MNKPFARRATTREVADYDPFPFGERSLINSRVSGVLAGKPAPKFIKMGSRVFYDLDDIDAWVAQFPQFNTTSEYPEDQAATSTAEHSKAA